MTNPYHPITPEQRTANDYHAWIENEAYLEHQEKQLLERVARAKRTVFRIEQNDNEYHERNQHE